MVRTFSSLLRPWVKVCLASGFAVFAAVACLFWVSNGIVAGAIIGLPGREADVNVAQHHALVWFALCVVFLLGQVAVVYSLLPLGEDADHLARFVARVPLAAAVSVVTTSLLVWLAFELAVRFHH